MVDRVGIEVERGEFFGIIGSNGAGKTTLLKCLSTLLEIDGGEAFVNGYSVRSQPDEVRLAMNLVGSGHWVGFDWGMNLVENLHFFGSLYRLDRANRQARIDQTLEQLGMGHLAGETPRTLSTGERQRLLLAKGFYDSHAGFFLDEPTAGLDPEGAREVREFVQKDLIGMEGTSSILTTHRMHCEDADAALGEVVDALRRHHVDVDSVESQEPTLEDAFIALTDRRLE